MIAGPGARDEQDAPFALQILVVGQRILGRGSDRGPGRDHACSTPMTATAWNSRPFMPCMVPARTAFLVLCVVSAR